MASDRAIQIDPSARRLTGSLRDIGYDFTSAVADLLDNSIAARASRIDITLKFQGEDSWVRIADNGDAMTPGILNEAMRFGTRRNYNGHDLGRFGLGLKTASLSQCRQLMVASRVATERRRIHIRRLDLDHIASADRWEVHDLMLREAPRPLVDPVLDGTGTVILWRKLDRVLDYDRPEGAWAARRMDRLGSLLKRHLGMVFHRFLEGTAHGSGRVVITVNGMPVEPWNPFAPEEPETVVLPARRINVASAGAGVEVIVRPYVLPHRSAFSNPDAFERMSGPGKWNRQQGFYIYRADRMIQSGGWNGMRAIDEHTKFARAAIEFKPDLDGEFQVNVAKMRVSLPQFIRPFLERSVSDLIREAGARYRRGELAAKSSGDNGSNGNGNGHGYSGLAQAGLAIRAAAMETGDLDAVSRISRKLFTRNKDLAAALGWTWSEH